MTREKGGDNVMKMTPSKLLNIVLVTVLATSLFFISTTASTAEYNPWSDIDGDGEITIYDVVKVTGIYGSSGDPTRNVTVTNWPEDRPPKVKKTIEKIVILETFNGGYGHGYGVSLGKPVFDDSTAFFLYYFKPKGELINVTEIFINYVWRADVSGSLSNPHLVELVFYEEVPRGGNFDMVDLTHGIGLPWTTKPDAETVVLVK